MPSSFSFHFKCDDSSHVSNLSVLVVVFTSSVVQVGELGAKLFPFTFFCVWHEKGLFDRKRRQAIAFPSCDFRLSVSFCVIHHPGPRGVVHYWPLRNGPDSPSAESWTQIPLSSSSLVVRHISSFVSSQAWMEARFFLRINFPFFIFHYGLCDATLSLKKVERRSQMCE